MIARIVLVCVSLALSLPATAARLVITSPGVPPQIGDPIHLDLWLELGPTESLAGVQLTIDFQGVRGPGQITQVPDLLGGGIANAPWGLSSTIAVAFGDPDTRITVLQAAPTDFTLESLQPLVDLGLALLEGRAVPLGDVTFLARESVSLSARYVVGRDQLCASVRGSCLLEGIDTIVPVRFIATADDPDGDGVLDPADNCRFVPNPDQSDLDADGVGNACNNAEDRDGDEWRDDLDNCPDTPDATQTDRDGNGVGEVCEPPAPRARRLRPGVLVIHGRDGVRSLPPTAGNRFPVGRSAAARAAASAEGLRIWEDGTLFAIEGDGVARDLGAVDLAGAEPADLAWDPQRDALWFTLPTRGSVVRARADGSEAVERFVFEAGLEPRAIEIDGDGRPWVAVAADATRPGDAGLWRLDDRDPSSASLEIPFEAGSGSAAADFALGDDGRVYVAQPERTRIAIYDADGVRAEALEAGLLDRPLGIEIDEVGDLLVLVEARVPRVVRIDAATRRQRLELSGDNIDGTALARIPFPDADRDGDGLHDTFDPCPDLAEDVQSDRDADGVGDACDPFPDSAEHALPACAGALDRCEADAEPCSEEDVDPDGDGLVADNCPEWWNPDQTDRNADGIGDVCTCGDANGDGHLDMTDLHAVSSALLAARPPPLCDANGDRRCDLLDIFAINDALVGRERTRCVFEPTPRVRP